MITMFTIYTAILGSIIGFSTLTAFVKIYYSDKYKNRVYLSTSILISLLSALVFFLLIYVAGHYLVTLYEFKVWWLYTGIALVFFEDIISIQTLLFRMESKIFKFGLFELSRIFLRSVVTIFFVVSLNFGEDGPILSNLITAFIFLIISMYILYANKSISFYLRYNYVKHALSFGVPLMPHVLFGTLSTTIDKIVIAAMISKTELGVYAIGFAVGGIIKALEGSIYMAYQPWFFKEISKERPSKKEIRRSNLLIMAGLLISSLIVIAASNNFLHYYVGSQFVRAVEIVPWIAIAFAVNGAYTMANQVVLFKNKTGMISVITIFTVILGIFVTYIMTERNGVVGAAQALLIVISIRAAIMLVYSNKLYCMEWFQFIKKQN
jgi:O-antigen/teichoic acid export membrane protein